MPDENKSKQPDATAKKAAPKAAHDDDVAGKAYDSRLMRRLLTYLRPYKLQTGLSALSILLRSFTDVSGPLLVKMAVDTYMSGRTQPAQSWLARHLSPVPYTGVTELAGLYFLALCASFGLDLVQ